MMMMPMVKDNDGNRSSDLLSRLLDDRVILLSGEVCEEMAALVVAQLLYLESANPDSDIALYINSPGGVVTAGLAILDTMNHIRCDVSTICMGQAASMGAVLLAAGAKGKRYVLPNSEVMIHQPLGGMQGQATDLQIHAKHAQRTKERLLGILKTATGQEEERLLQDMERDYFLTAQEAVAYGLADKCLSPQMKKEDA